MISRPDKILLVTERPLLALTFRELLDKARWDTGYVLLRPEELEGSTGAEMAALVVIDAETELPWAAYTDLLVRSPRSHVVVWCSQVTPQVVQAAMEAGVHGLLSVRLTISDAAEALVRVWKGQRQFRFEGELQARTPHEPGLTPREQQVVALVMEGRRNREIAEALHTTEGSVKVYMNRIFSKTGAKNRNELALAGHNIVPRREPAARTRAVGADIAEPFDAVWMLTSGHSDFRATGVSYDSVKR
jgi:DNA-binding NarL/FixJ family response regulator